MASAGALSAVACLSELEAFDVESIGNGLRQGACASLCAEPKLTVDNCCLAPKTSVLATHTVAAYHPHKMMPKALVYGARAAAHAQQSSSASFRNVLQLPTLQSSQIVNSPSVASSNWGPGGSQQFTYHGYTVSNVIAFSPRLPSHAVTGGWPCNNTCQFFYE